MTKTKVNTVESLNEIVDQVVPGVQIEVEGYKSSSGIPENFTAKICDLEAYRDIITKDLEKLNEMLHDEEVSYDTKEMIAKIALTKSASLEKEVDEDHKCVVAADDKVTLLGLLLDKPIETKEPKSDSAKLRWKISKDLPSANYAFRLVLQDEKFSEITIG